jgi:hypothetical protein
MTVICSSGFWRRVDSSPSSDLKMETVCFSETLASTDESTRRPSSEEQYHSHRREDLRCQDMTMLTVFIRLRIECCGGLL